MYNHFYLSLTHKVNAKATLKIVDAWGKSIATQAKQTREPFCFGWFKLFSFGLSGLTILFQTVRTSQLCLDTGVSKPWMSAQLS